MLTRAHLERARLDRLTSTKALASDSSESRCDALGDPYDTILFGKRHRGYVHHHDGVSWALFWSFHPGGSANKTLSVLSRRAAPPPPQHGAFKIVANLW